VSKLQELKNDARKRAKDNGHTLSHFKINVLSEYQAHCLDCGMQVLIWHNEYEKYGHLITGRAVVDTCTKAGIQISAM
jgi:hypothetical protein